MPGHIIKNAIIPQFVLKNIIMNWIGKILGALFGLLLLGPFGALLGVIVGHYFDKGLHLNWTTLRTNRAMQPVFFDATFSVMGYIAKADGRISEREIRLARLMMQRLGLQGERKHDAMRQFTKGKAADFAVDTVLNHLHQHCAYQHLLRLFIDLQVQMAYADGTPSTNIKRILQHISQQLGLAKIDFSHIEAMLYGQWQQHHSSQRQYTQSQTSSADIKEAYTILDITTNASIEEIKKAYRRKMNENHPDKMIAKGLPKEMIELATEKTQQIKAAYEQIKNIRGF